MYVGIVRYGHVYDYCLFDTLIYYYQDWSSFRDHFLCSYHEVSYDLDLVVDFVQVGLMKPRVTVLRFHSLAVTHLMVEGCCDVVISGLV